MVNQSIGYDQKRTAHMGENFDTIDFDVHPVTKQQVERLQMKTIMGELLIAGKKIKCSIGEVDHLIETLQDSRQVFMQKYRFGT